MSSLLRGSPPVAETRANNPSHVKLQIETSPFFTSKLQNSLLPAELIQTSFKLNSITLIANSFRSHSEFIQKVLRCHPELIQNSFRNHRDLILNPRRTHSERIQNSFRNPSELIQAELNHTHCEFTQMSFRTHAESFENPSRFHSKFTQKSF